LKQLNIQSPAVAHGIGLFETMLVLHGRPILAGEHYERMCRSAAEIGFPLPGERRFHDAVSAAACSVADSAEAAVRCVYAAGGSIADAEAWALAVEAGPIPPITMMRRMHGRAMTLDASYVRSLPQHKLTSYAVCVIGLQRAITAGADEALFVDAAGQLLEGTATNVFAIGGDTLITPAVSAGILPGVTRAWVVEAAQRAGLRVAERSPSVAELMSGGFLAGSLTLLAPIRVLNGQACDGPGAAFTALHDDWSRHHARG
jgi:branched-subunit amino acid aminotransferase/4-amino-4-deoxychorismate lyase